MLSFFFRCFVVTVAGGQGGGSRAAAFGAKAAYYTSPRIEPGIAGFGFAHLHPQFETPGATRTPRSLASTFANVSVTYQPRWRFLR